MEKDLRSYLLALDWLSVGVSFVFSYAFYPNVEFSCENRIMPESAFERGAVI